MEVECGRPGLVQARGCVVIANRPEAGPVWAKSSLRDRIDAIIAHEHAESLTGDHDLAEAMAPNSCRDTASGPWARVRHSPSGSTN